MYPVRSHPDLVHCLLVSLAYIAVTVKHILVKCPNLQNTRNKYFSVSCLRDLFESVDNHVIIDFIKDTNFYHLV